LSQEQAFGSLSQTLSTPFVEKWPVFDKVSDEIFDKDSETAILGQTLISVPQKAKPLHDRSHAAVFLGNPQ
jgi:hypothetical protein